MGALAGLLRSAGHEVSGSDLRFDPPIGPELEHWGIRCLEGYEPAHLDDPRPDLVVVGNVCRKDNPEAVAAFARGLRVTTMPHALADFALEPFGVSPLVVCGTHGKTTTSTMAAWILDRAGMAPGFFIGGLPKNFETSFRLPPAIGGARLPLMRTSPASPRRVPFVVEGDEYDTAFFEKTPKFWHYRADVAILTSIEHDHVDIYPDELSYEAAFRGMLERLPPHGLCVAAAADARVVRLVTESARCAVRWFAVEGDDTHGISPEWVAAPVPFGEGMQAFDLFAGGVACGRFAMPVPGIHNVRNALAAVAAAVDGYACNLPDLAKGLATFEGVRRRQDLIADIRGIRVYDDFAHHPTAVRETLQALRAKHSHGRLWAVFEPRSATACRALHQEAYAEAFTTADRILLAPLGRTNVPEAERLDRQRVIEGLRARGKDARAVESVDAIVEMLARELASGDVVAVLSNGAFGGLYAKLTEALSK